MLRLLIVLLWIPISTQATVHHFENQETRLELSEILARMDSTESILLFSLGHTTLITDHQQSTYDYDVGEVHRNISLLNEEYKKYKNNPYASQPHSTELILERLYSILIGPARPFLKRKLRIQYDRSTYEVPWNLLKDESGIYLAESFVIVVDPALLLKRTKTVLVDSLSALLIAPEFIGHEAIENKWENDHLRKIFKKSKDPHAPIIHVSSHGVHEGILVSSEKTTWTTEDLHGLCLNTKLVFLNACYSKRMALAFLKTGAVTSIGVQWQVDDQLALQMMEHFYENLESGSDADEALQQAFIITKKALEAEGLDHPFLMGGYQVYGSGGAIVTASSHQYMKLASIVLSFFTTFSFLTYHLSGLVRYKLMEYNLI